MKRIKVINSHAGSARFWAETSDDPVAWLPRQNDIPSPYAYSPSQPVYEWHGKRVFQVETRHRRYEVFEVSPEDRTYETDDKAADAYLRT